MTDAKTLFDAHIRQHSGARSRLALLRLAFAFHHTACAASPLPVRDCCQPHRNGCWSAPGWLSFLPTAPRLQICQPCSFSLSLCVRGCVCFCVCAGATRRRRACTPSQAGASPRCIAATAAAHEREPSSEHADSVDPAPWNRVGRGTRGRKDRCRRRTCKHSGHGEGRGAAARTP